MKIISDPEEAQRLREAGEELVPFFVEVPAGDEEDHTIPELRWRTWTRDEKRKDRKALKSTNRKGRGPLPKYQPVYGRKQQQKRGIALLFAEFVKQRRADLGLTQQQLADAAGISRVGLAYIEGGQRRAKPRTQKQIRAALLQAQVGRVKRFAAALNQPQEVAA